MKASGTYDPIGVIGIDTVINAADGCADHLPPAKPLKVLGNVYLLLFNQATIIEDKDHSAFGLESRYRRPLTGSRTAGDIRPGRHPEVSVVAAGVNQRLLPSGLRALLRLGCVSIVFSKPARQGAKQETPLQVY